MSARGVEPRVLLLDIETLPYQVTTWDNFPRAPISHENIVKETQMLCAAWKWQGTAKVYSKMIKRGGTDEDLTRELHRIIGLADAVVAHYGDGFDIPWIQARCLKWRLGPLKPVVQIDTWKICKAKFKLFNNKLDYVARYLGVGKKIKTDFDLWKKCLAGKRVARKKMLRYNKQDVRLLEQVYLRVLPFVQAKLNRAMYVYGHELGQRTCPTCGSQHVHRHGMHFTRTGERFAYQCLDCKAWFYRLTNTRAR